MITTLTLRAVDPWKFLLDHSAHRRQQCADDHLGIRGPGLFLRSVNSIMYSFVVGGFLRWIGLARLWPDDRAFCGCFGGPVREMEAGSLRRIELAYFMVPKQRPSSSLTVGLSLPQIDRRR